MAEMPLKRQEPPLDAPSAVSAPPAADMPVPALKRPWERQTGEPGRPYACFAIYRDLGPDRSLTAAVRLYLTVKPDSRATTRLRQQRRFRAHEKPRRYVLACRSQWGRWSRGWRWVDRATAFDNAAAAEADHRAFEAAIEAKLSEQRENEKQAKLRLDEARMARAAGRSIIRRFLQLVEQGEVASLGMLRTKDVVIEQSGRHTTKREVEKKGIVELLRLAIPAVVEAQKMERRELGEPDEKHEISLPAVAIDRLAEVIMARTPEADWEAVAGEVAAVLKGTHGDGTPG